MTLCRNSEVLILRSATYPQTWHKSRAIKSSERKLSGRQNAICTRVLRTLMIPWKVQNHDAKRQLIKQNLLNPTRFERITFRCLDLVGTGVERAAVAPRVQSLETTLMRLVTSYKSKSIINSSGMRNSPPYLAAAGGLPEAQLRRCLLSLFCDNDETGWP